MRIQLAPPSGAQQWIVMRNATGVFAGPADPTATIVAQTNEATIYDADGLVNGTPYFYQAFYWNGVAYTADPAPASGTPAANYFDDSTDALTLLRNRLDAGLQTEIARGALAAPKDGGGVIKVLTAPPIFEETRLPVVVVHLTSEAPAEHGIGELVGQDLQMPDGMWNETEGWLAKTTISVVGWALNPDVRIALRKSLRRLVVGNLQVFYAAGLRDIDFSQEDAEDLSGTYGAPVYFAQGTFSCLSPIVVGGQVPTIAGVTLTPTLTPTFTEEIVLPGSLQ